MQKKINVSVWELINAPKYVDDSPLWALINTKEFADYLVKAGYDGIIAKEHQDKSVCFGIPYIYPNRIKNVHNMHPSRNNNINEYKNQICK